MKKRIQLFFRLVQINFILARHGLDNLILSLHLFAPLRFLIYLNPYNWFRSSEFNQAVATRRALEALGPMFVKFGQAMSTRRDLIPGDIADELAKLQDNVPPFDSKLAHQIIAEQYGKPAHEVFASFEDTPLASASIAQVHAAKLTDGRDVIVKIVRPNMHAIIQRDLDLLYILAGLVQKYYPRGHRLRPLDVVSEFEKTILDELDLVREAANASTLRRNFAHSKDLYIPEIMWPYCQQRVMVMERIYGIPVNDIDTLRAHNVNLKRLAEKGVDIFFRSVFRDCFFHADMHPGNIFVDIANPQDPKLIAVDFGIMGSLPDEDQRYLAANFLAFFNRDYREVARLHIESGWVPEHTRIDELEGAIRAVCEPILEKPLKDISAAKLMLRLLQIGRRFNMVLLPQLVLLQKTLFAIEGLGRNLYPELDLWSTAKPVLETWVGEQLGPRGFIKKMRSMKSFWVEDFPEIPLLLHKTLKQMHKPIQAPVQPKTPAKSFYNYGLATAFLASAGLSIYPNLQLQLITLPLVGLGAVSLIAGWLQKA